MMETIKPYRDKLIQAKRQLDQAWKGETASVPVVTSSQPDDVHELRENLSRVSIIHWRHVYFTSKELQKRNFEVLRFRPKGLTRVVVHVLQLVKWIRGDAEDQLNKFSKGADSLRSANQNKAKFDGEFYPLTKVW